MPPSRANQRYWSLVGELMHREGLTQRQAGHEVIVRAIVKAQRQGFTPYAAIRKLEKQWGLHFTTLYEHLAKARETILIP